MSVLTLDHSFTANDSSPFSNVPLSIDYMFFVTGDLGGGKMALEASPDGGVTWFTVDQLVGPGRLIRYLVSGEKVKLTLCDSTTTPNCSAGIRQ
jgi:hypothetical protein